MSLEVKRKGNPTDIESWLTRFPTLFRRGRHPATCRWCDGPLTIVSVATDEAAATGPDAFHHATANVCMLVAPEASMGEAPETKGHGK
jgi:hypothetical protein